MKDLWDAEFVQTLKGPRSSTLFVNQGGEGHFLFSLNIDFFNIEGNLQQNASTSCGIISCACLNLSLSIHYKLKNMYLAGIISSPNKPYGDQLNYFLDPPLQDTVRHHPELYRDATSSAEHGRLFAKHDACWSSLG
ncbi:hypothetical protein HD554DRAFT_2019274 [Boletus coccyginus]|nr:hypothetical protein HD554DRAFT_2019274 [Boletus coccyginus]